MEKGKVVSIEDRIPKLKQQRRKKANRRLIFLLMLFFLLIIFIIYFQSPLSNVKYVNVSGNITFSNEEIEELSGISKSSNIWMVNKEKTAEKLNTEAEIKSSKVSIKLPNTVNIVVEEYKRMAYMVNDTKFTPILENGGVLQSETTESVPLDTPLLFDFKEDNTLTKLVEELTNLPNEVYNAISEVHYTPSKTDSYHINVYMNDGFEVSASLSTFSEKMAHYPSIVSQLNPNKKGIIDLEVGSFFREYETEGENN